MAAKLVWANRRLTGYLAGASGLLLFGLSGLMVKGSLWLIFGLFCWIAIVSGLFMGNIQSYHGKCLKDYSNRNGRTRGGRRQGNKI